MVNLDRMLLGSEHIPSSTKAIIHTHIDVNLPVIRAMHARVPKLAHARAISYYENFNAKMIEAFGLMLPTVIPMRDPLLSIITRHARHPEQAPHTYLVDSWYGIPECNPFYVPVDLPFSELERVVILSSALAHCRIAPWPEVKDYARAWKPVNAFPGALVARAAYNRRDKGWFEEHFPEEWAALRSAHDVKRLFSDQGYEDLLWW